MNRLCMMMITIAVTALSAKKADKTMASSGMVFRDPKETLVLVVLTKAIANRTATITEVIPVNIPGATVISSQRMGYTREPTFNRRSSWHSGQMGFVRFLTL